MNKRAVELARDLIAKFEGFSSRPYQDVVGIYTIGYGHVILEDEAFGEITEDEGLDILEGDLAVAVECVDKCVAADLTDNQAAALVSFAFNVGCGALRKSTLLRLLNDGRYDDVPAQFLRWNRAGGQVVRGLTNRRRAEAALFAS